jgi:hypothetical protein
MRARAPFFTRGLRGALFGRTESRPVSLWFVLRDDRGGLAWRTARVTVTP